MKPKKRLEYYSNKLKELKSSEKRLDFSSFPSNPEELSIPTFIFHDRSIAVLEAITEYLKDENSLTYHEIAVLLNRDDRTIWTCYDRAKKKRKQAKNAKADAFVNIPPVIFQDRNLAVLEILVEFLKEQNSLTYHEIAVLLNRDDRTIWTVYSRAKKKRNALNLTSKNKKKKAGKGGGKI